jgi:hypothetical protein
MFRISFRFAIADLMQRLPPFGIDRRNVKPLRFNRRRTFERGVFANMAA